MELYLKSQIYCAFDLRILSYLELISKSIWWITDSLHFPIASWFLQYTRTRMLGSYSQTWKNTSWNKWSGRKYNEKGLWILIVATSNYVYIYMLVRIFIRSKKKKDIKWPHKPWTETINQVNKEIISKGEAYRVNSF